MKPREYIDFKLYLTGVTGDDACEVTLLPTPEVGETGSPVRVQTDVGPDAGLLPFLAGKAIEWRQLVTLGKGLANWLLPEGEIRKLYEQALNQVGNKGGVRLRLIFGDQALKKWPWEYTYHDPLGGSDSMRGFLALDPRISIVRHEPLPIPHPGPARSDSTLTCLPIIVAAASPEGQAKLKLDREVSNIREALADLDVDGVAITPEPVLMHATPLDVADALRGAGSAFIFHFVGHGTVETHRDRFTRGASVDQGVLFFVEDKATNSQIRVPADLLAQQLQQADVRLAVFGACYSGLGSEQSRWDGVAGALAYRRIPAVVAMQYAVIDSQAIVFARAFYGALAAGLSLDEAMTLGRLAIYQDMPASYDGPVNVEWGVPVLYTRLPDGVILPERADAGTETANKLRSVIQRVGTIHESGVVVGVDAATLEGSFDVNQTVKDVLGRLVGFHGTGDSVHIVQDLGTVSGEVTGVDWGD
ncbi:MAG TPA: CHAT domain-containing protein [Anaerolineae bacterium]|nr:CHAT domain-containing protein [Anaerolineae bacterium]